MMDCNRCREHLIEFTEGLLSRTEEAQIRAHVEHCRSCQAQLARIRKTLSLIEHDPLPRLSPARKHALFPLVMQNVAQRTRSVRQKRRWSYAFGSALAMAMVLIFSLVAFRNQRQTDYYTVFFNPDRLIYSDDSAINEYLLHSLIEDDATVSDMDIAVNEAWIRNSELDALVDDLSDDEIDKLIEKLETFDLNGG
jgi:hypothetical protein